MSLLEMAGGLLAGVVVGYVGHELTHYVVAVLAGRRPMLSLCRMSVELDVHPLTWEVRLAAVAPALVGVLVCAAAIFVEAWTDPPIFAFLAGVAVRMFALSPADRRIALGTAYQWGN